MENFVEKLKKYFETTSREQVLKDWEETKDFDEVGPTIEEFIQNTNENIKNNARRLMQCDKKVKTNK